MRPSAATVSAIDQAQALMRACRYGEAESFIEAQIPTATPGERGLLLIARGNVAEHQGDLDGAIARYTAAAEGETIPSDALRFLGLAQIRRQRFDEGHRNLSAYLVNRLRRPPYDRPVQDLAALAVAAAELGRIEEATDLVNQIVEHVDAFDPLVLDLRDALAATGGKPATPGHFWKLAYGSPVAWSAVTLSYSAVPTYRKAPRYPKDAARRRLEGSVMMEVQIDERGDVTDAIVRDAHPKGVFEDPSLRAVRQWKFKPASINCTVAPQRLIQRIDYKMER